MQPDSRPFTESWKEWAVPGEIIQIRGENNLLFRPRVSTRPFWLFLRPEGASGAAVGPASLIILSAVFNCRRLFPRRGESIKVPALGFHADEIERARGKLLHRAAEDQPFVLDLGFPMVVDQLDKCPEILKAQVGDIIELELVPPTKAYII